MEEGVLVVGLGNPGVAYERTRHNLGFIVVRALGERYGLSFKRVEKLEGELAIGSINGRKLYLFLPMTYMNLSGRAVKKVVDYYKIPLDEASFLVVVDDIYINFNSMRLRASGGTGGHNGLKSLEEYLHSKHYSRLRLGIGPQIPGVALEDFVLDKFTSSERELLGAFVQRSVCIGHCWLHEGLERAHKLMAELNIEEENR